MPQLTREQKIKVLQLKRQKAQQPQAAVAPEPAPTSSRAPQGVLELLGVHEAIDPTKTVDVAKQGAIDVGGRLLSMLIPGSGPLIEGTRNLNRIPKDFIEPTMATVGGMAGSATGIPGSTIVGTGAGGGMGRAIVRGREALLGEGKGAEQSVEESGKEALKTGATDTALAALGIPVARGVAGAAKLGGRTVRALANKADPQLVKIGGRIRESFVTARQGIGKTFDRGLDMISEKYPTLRVNLQDTFTNLAEQAKNLERLGADIRSAAKRSNTPLLNEVLADPTKAADLTLREAQTLKNALNQASSIRAKGKRFMADFEKADTDLFDHIDDIRGNMLSAVEDVTPQGQDNLLKALNKEYSEKITQFRRLRNKFKPESLESAASGRLGSAQLREDAKKLLPKETLRDLQLLGDAVNIPKIAGQFGGSVLKEGGRFLLLNELFKRANKR